MQKNKAPGRQWSSLYYSFVLMSCLVFLSSCTFSTANNSTDAVKPQAKILSSVTKSADPARDKAQVILAKMSLDNKITQMIMVEFIGTDYVATGLQQMVAQQQVGGVLYQPSDGNFDAPNDTVASVHDYSAQIIADEKIAPLISIDEEGGWVDKISTFFGSTPSAMDLASSGQPQRAYNQAKLYTSELKRLGINTDLAPVVDVGPYDPQTYVSRRFSTDPNTVAIYAGEFVKGLQDNGIPATLKHFPGLGDTSQNPHDEVVTITRNMTDLQNIDLLPYQKIIQQDNPAMVMTTDVLMTAMDANQFAELSPKVIDYLRHTLKFNGVIITDGMYMKGLYNGYRPSDEQLTQACVQAIEAGNDMIEGPSLPSQISSIVAGVKAEIQQGKLSQSQIDQSVMRILMMKIKYGIIK